MSSMQHTTAQLEAIGARGAVSVRAGAGSGKTGVLTARYLRALDEGLQPGDIVAVTFTEKAAAEMRARIRRGIDERAMSPPARTQLQEALPDAPINTIHGLCASILREFPIEAGVDPAFEIADESHAWALKREAIDATITDAAGDPRHPARPHLETLLSYYTRGEVAALVDEVSAVRRYFDSDATALMALPPAELLASWRRRIHDEATARLDALAGSARVQRVLDFFRTSLPLCSDPEDKLLAVARIALDSFQATSSDGAPEPIQLIAALAEAFLTKDNDPRSFSKKGADKNWRGGDISMVRDAAGQLAEDLVLIAPLRACTPHERDECTARLVHAAWRLADAVDDSYSDLKGRGRVLDFDDLETSTIGLFASAAGRPALVELQERCRLLLVDESQDLNLLQYRLIEQLGGGAATERLFVGDPQQSIFGFRNADVRLIDRIDEHLVGSSGTRVLLDVNFRSSAPLLAFANRLFLHLLSGAEEFHVAYSGMQPHRGNEASTQIELVLAAQADDDGGPAAFDPAAAAVAQRVTRLVDEGRLVSEPAPDGCRRVRPVRYGDIAVLLRTRGPLTGLRRAFRSLGIPHLVYKGIGFYQTQEVRDLTMCLRFLADPSYDLGLAAVLRSPLFALSDDALFALARGRGNGTLFDVLLDETAAIDLAPEDALVLERARRLLPSWRALVDRLRPSAILQHVLADTGAWGAYASLGVDGNLQKLVRIVRSLQEPFVPLAGIATALAEHIHATPREGTEPESPLDADAVKIMTVHAAKGLEFPVVFVLGLEDNLGRRPSTPTMLTDPDLGVAVQIPKAFAAGSGCRGAMYEFVNDHVRRKEIAEEKRLLYVAATRAEDHLFLVCAERQQEAKESWWRWITGALDIAWLVPDTDGANVVDLGNGTTLSVTRETHGSLPPPRPRPREEQPLPSTEFDPAALAARLAPIAPENPVELITISQLRDLDRCPRLYHARHISGIRFDAPVLAPDEDGSGAADELPDDGAQRIVGVVVHRLIERHGETAAPLQETALQSARLETLDTALAGRVAERAVAIMQRFLRSDAAARFLGGPVCRELPFALRVNGGFLRGRIDQLDCTQPPLIVDYKTPAEPQAVTAASLNKEYGLQLRVYALAASRLLQATTVRAAVVLPEIARVFEWEYGPAELRATATDLSDRLARARRFDLAEELKVSRPCGRCPACRALDG